MGMVKHSQSYQNSRFAMSLQYLKKDVRDEVDFLHVDKHQSFLQVDLNTLSIKILNKVILSLLIGMFKHSQSTQSIKLAITLQYLTNEVSHKAFLVKIDKESFTRIIKYFSVVTAFVFYCDAKHSDI